MSSCAFNANSLLTQQVNQTVTYALNKGFWVILNTHHESWLKNGYDGTSQYNGACDVAHQFVPPTALFRRLFLILPCQMPCLVLSCLVLSCLVLSCRVVSCRVVPCLVLERLVLSWNVLSWNADKFWGLWRGIANYFKTGTGASRRLIFEVLNEPEGVFGDWHSGIRGRCPPMPSPIGPLRVLGSSPFVFI